MCGLDGYRGANTPVRHHSVAQYTAKLSAQETQHKFQR